MNKTEQALRAARDLRELIDLTTHQYEVVNEAAYILEALSQSEAPAERPEDERSRFETQVKIVGFDNLAREGDGYSWPPSQYAWLGWKAAKRDALTQAPQERAAVTDAEILDAARAYGMDMGDVYEFSETSIVSMVRSLLSLAQSSEGKKP